MKLNKQLGTLAVALAVAGGTTLGLGLTNAEAQGPGGGLGGDRGGLAPIMEVCSTTDYTAVVAQALGVTAAELRVALVSGKTVAQVAQEKGVQLSAALSALVTARKADVEAAYKDGLLTEAQYNERLTRLDAAAQTTPTNLRVPSRNEVNEVNVAAQALSMTCADLVKALQTNQTVARVAEGKSVQVQTVIDAVANAIKEALAKDVSEGLITQAQADARSLRLTEQAAAFVYGFGGRGRGLNLPFGPGGGRDGRGGRGQDRPPAQPTQPAPTATPNS